MNQRHATTLRAAAATLLIVALGCMIPASAANAGEANTSPSVGATPVARGMLIPARMRLMVRFSPSRTA